MNIGFIGLGLMGGSIVSHLAKKVSDLLVYDIMSETRNRFLETTRVAQEITGVIDFADVLILSLPGSPEVEATVDEILDRAVEGKTVIDLSTSYPSSSKRIAEALEERGAQFLDASLTGSPATAKEGRLQAIVGGRKDVYENLQPVFSLFTERTFYAGGSGTGNLLKLATNYLAILYINLYSEIFSIVEKNGGDLEVLFEVVSKGAAGCGMFERIAPKIMSDEYEISFLLKHAIKDLTYTKRLAIEGGIPSLMLDAGLSQFLVAKSEGLENRDVSEVARVLKNWILT